MRLHVPSVALLLALAACSTPQERCISTNSRDLRTLDHLIAESEANLQRGFAVSSRIEWRDEMVPCYYPSRRYGGRPLMRWCWDERPVNVKRPYSINLDQEAAKLASLKRKRVELARRTQGLVEQCRELHPE